MKVIIAGSREFDDYETLCRVCDYMLQNQNLVEIVSGTANGADKLGERYARERGYNVTRFPADWDAYGKSAGYRRNVKMAEYADAAIIFWNGRSKGTRHMIDIAKTHKLKLKIHSFT